MELKKIDFNNIDEKTKGYIKIGIIILGLFIGLFLIFFMLSKLSPIMNLLINLTLIISFYLINSNKKDAYLASSSTNSKITIKASSPRRSVNFKILV